MAYMISSGITSTGIVLNRNSMTVLDCGTANGTIISSGGHLHVSSGGTANETTVNSISWLSLSSGGKTNNTTINSAGNLFVYYGGVADHTTVQKGGNLSVSSGGTATNIVMSSGAFIRFDVASSTYVQGISNGTAFEMKDANISGYSLDTGRLTVSFGGVAEKTIVNEDGQLIVSSGGIAIDTTVKSGSIHVFFGELSNTILGKDGWVGLSGGVAISTTVNSNGEFGVYDEGVASNTVIKKGGWLDLWGGTTDGTTISSGGSVQVQQGTACNTVVKNGGCMWINEGGIVNHVTVDAGGNLRINDGGIIAGQMIINSGAHVSAYEGAILAFDISNVAPGMSARINSLSRISGWGDAIFVLSVSSLQASGDYLLAKSATGFNKTITILNTLGESLGVIVVGGTLAVNEESYELKLDNGALVLSIKGKVPPIPINDSADFLWNKKDGWNDANIKVQNTVSGIGEINLDEEGTIDDKDKHNMFGNDGTNKDAGDVAKIAVEDTAKLTFTIDSTAAGTFYVYEKVKQKGKDKQITVGKVTVKANTPATLNAFLADTGDYYVAMVAKSTKKGSTGLYNVNVTGYSVFVDADKETNNTDATAKMVELKRGTTAIVLDRSDERQHKGELRWFLRQNGLCEAGPRIQHVSELRPRVRWSRKVHSLETENQWRKPDKGHFLDAEHKEQVYGNYEGAVPRHE